MELLVPSQNKRIDSAYYVEGYATTFDRPYVLYEYDGIKYSEIIDRNALNGADLSDVIMQYDHQGKVLARQSNQTLVLEPNDKGIFIYADLSKSKAAQEMHEEITNGLITKMSWAFTVESEEYDRPTRTRKILKVKKVYDVSAVSIPANIDTQINARTWLDGAIEAEKQELLERQLELAKRKYFIIYGGNK